MPSNRTNEEEETASKHTRLNSHPLVDDPGTNLNIRKSRKAGSATRVNKHFCFPKMLMHDMY